MSGTTDSKRAAAAAFEEFRRRFENEGDRVALLDALRMSIHCGQQLPEWARKEACEALDGWRFWKYRSLDQAFDVQRKKGENITGQRQQFLHMFSVHAHVKNLIADGKKSTEKAISEVADLLTLSPDKVERLYHEAACLIEKQKPPQP